MNQPTAHFRVGQRVVCIDASPNKRYGVAVPGLKRGGIYIVRGIDHKPGWEAPGWGVHVEGIRVMHPDVGCEWAMRPGRFRPVVDRPTSIEVFRKLLAPPKKPAKAGCLRHRPRQLNLPLEDHQLPL
jgi:hypothetical protein